MGLPSLDDGSLHSGLPSQNDSLRPSGAAFRGLELWLGLLCLGDCYLCLGPLSLDDRFCLGILFQNDSSVCGFFPWTTALCGDTFSVRQLCLGILSLNDSNVWEYVSWTAALSGDTFLGRQLCLGILSLDNSFVSGYFPWTTALSGDTFLGRQLSLGILSLDDSSVWRYFSVGDFSLSGAAVPLFSFCLELPSLVVCLTCLISVW